MPIIIHNTIQSSKQVADLKFNNDDYCYYYDKIYSIRISTSASNIFATRTDSQTATSKWWWLVDVGDADGNMPR